MGQSLDRRLTVFCAVAYTLAVFAPLARGQETPARRVVAKVDTVSIYQDQVQQKLDQVLGQRKVDEAALPRLQAHALKQLVDREVVHAYLKRRNVAAHQQEIDAELSAIERELKTQRLTFDAYLNKSGQNRETFLRELAWKISWDAYVERNVNETTMPRYFKANRRQFDGTQIRVSQILLRPKGTSDTAALLAQAATIRQQIASGAVTFAAAAKKHSAGPSAAQGGDLGYIRRRGSMGETFSKSAFALEKGAVSQPVVSQFGVHLIECTDVRPGTKTWTDVRDELQQAMIRYLFAWLADRERSESTVQFTGAMPYFKPGTSEVVPPGK